MLEQLKGELRASLNFPSPPAIAQQLIALARDTHADISQIASVISRDSSLAGRLLRVANSTLYSRQRKSTNLRQALIVLELQGATTLALSLALAGAYMGLKSNRVDSARHWRRAVVGAAAARCLGTVQDPSTAEGMFLAALLQDVAILGVDRAAPDFYRDLPRHASHRERCEYEQARLGVDHAELGAWLLEYWKLPGSLCRAVAGSHAPPAEDRSTPAGIAACCVALGSECAELLTATEPPRAGEFVALAQNASQWLGLDAPTLVETLGRIVAEIPEIERWFDLPPLQRDALNTIPRQARELLIPRATQAPGQAGSARADPRPSEARSAALQEEQRHDRLTGLYNRGYLDLILRREFQAATSGRWPLSLVFVDLDRFRAINEAHGHAAGDAVLVTTAKSIAAVARDSDYVARYGGKEFVILLPGLPSSGAEIFCERLFERLRGTSHTIDGALLTVTASVGLATHAPDSPFERASHLIEAAERSKSFAKRTGRDRLVRFNSGAHMATAKT